MGDIPYEEGHPVDGKEDVPLMAGDKEDILLFEDIHTMDDALIYEEAQPQDELYLVDTSTETGGGQQQREKKKTYGHRSKGHWPKSKSMRNSYMECKYCGKFRLDTNMAHHVKRCSQKPPQPQDST